MEAIRSFLAGRTMGEAVCDERRATVGLLKDHGLASAIRATAGSNSFEDYYRMRGALLAGGLHRVRLNGGRGIEPLNVNERSRSR